VPEARCIDEGRGSRERGVLGFTSSSVAGTVTPSAALTRQAEIHTYPIEKQVDALFFC